MKYVISPVERCPGFKEGQEFIFQSFQKPEVLCDWAWNDIYKTVVILTRGGDFSKDIFNRWMKNNSSMITCCTDGIRPVFFKVERIED